MAESGRGLCHEKMEITKHCLSKKSLCDQGCNSLGSLQNYTIDASLEGTIRDDVICRSLLLLLLIPLPEQSLV